MWFQKSLTGRTYGWNTDPCFKRSKNWLTNCLSGNADENVIFKRIFTYYYKHHKAKRSLSYIEKDPDVCRFDFEI